MTTITCKLPESLAIQLETLAREERQSKSAVLRDALEFRLKQQKVSPQLRASDFVGHLCGSIQGGPTDLATNADHLRGFGE